jgi:hypothetical protein
MAHVALGTAGFILQYHPTNAPHSIHSSTTTDKIILATGSVVKSPPPPNPHPNTHTVGYLLIKTAIEIRYTLLGYQTNHT